MHSKRLRVLQTLFWTLILFLISTVSLALTDSEIEEKIQDTLSQIHPTDTPEWWRALGAKAPKIIIEMQKKVNTTYQKLRLVEALAWFEGDKDAKEFLKNEVNNEEDVIRNAAIKSLGRSQGASEVSTISKFLKHRDPQTRVAAAETLRAIEDPEAKKVFSEYLKEEKSTWIVNRIQGVTPTSKPFKANIKSALQNFVGIWNGYWIRPKDKSLDVVSDMIRVEFFPVEGNDDELSGTVISRTAFRNQSRMLNLTSVRVEENKIKMHSKLPYPSEGSQSLKGEWGTLPRGKWLRIDLQEKGSLFVSRASSE